jgi:thiamine biosynthesis lipoprotein
MKAGDPGLSECGWARFRRGLTPTTQVLRRAASAILWPGFLVWILALSGIGCRTGSAVDAVRCEYRQTHMGMPFRIVLYAADQAAGDEAAAAAFGRIAELNRILSDYEADSELSRLSKTSGTGAVVPLSPDLARVLERAESISRLSDGAFDITVGPLVDVWKRARRQRMLPEVAKVEAARAATGWRQVVLGRDAAGRTTAHLKVPGMRLDLGGIAKGYALDEATRVLKARGIGCSLVSGGGDLFASGAPPGQRGWKVEIGELDVPQAPPGRVVWLKNRALVTSGDRFQRVELGGVRYSHLLDPRTGWALTHPSQVTLIGPEAMTTDALSKVLSVLGPDSGFERIRKLPVEAFLMHAPRGPVEVRQTPGWHRYERP